MMRQIDDIEQWNAAKSYFQDHSYKLWQFQYGFDTPDGFHAWFTDLAHNDIEIVTFKEDVQEAIIEMALQIERDS